MASRTHSTDVRARGRARAAALRETAWAMGAAVVAFVVGAWSLRLWAWNPANPIDLGWDNTQIAMQMKDLHDHGWYWSNPDIGFPFGQNGSWFPELNVLHLAVVKILELVTSGPFAASGVYFVLSFPLTAVATYLLARSQGLSPAAGLVAGVLLANAPGHAGRYGHLHLAQYWVVPVAMWLVLEVSRGRPLLSPPGPRRWVGKRSLVTVAAVLVVGFSGVYYVGFTMILLVVAALGRRVTGSPVDLLRGLAVTVALGVCIALPLAASRLATAGDLVTGRVPAQRAPAESELFSGKLMDLVLPWPGHRVGTLEFLSFVYNGTTRATVEVSALGVVGAAGMAGLAVVGLLALLSGRRPDQQHARWSGLMLVAFLFYTVGGLGSFVAFFATGQVRTWSRLQLYILVLALLAVGSWLTRLQRRRGTVVALSVAGLLTVVGSLDQTNPSEAPDHSAIATEMDGLRAYTSDLHEATGGGCGVFQLPVLPYPETLGPVDMQGYDQLKPYLAGSDLKFSFGAMRGTAAADWMLAAPTDDVRRLATELRAAGFCAVEVDTAGFTDDQDPSAALTETLGEPVARTSDGTFVAWALPGAADSDTDRNLLLEPVVVTVDGYEPDRIEGRPGQDLGPIAGLSFGNLGDTPVEVTATLRVRGVGHEPREVVLRDGDTTLATTTISDDAPGTVSVTRAVDPGRTSLTIEVSGDPERPVGEEHLRAARVESVEVSSRADVRVVAHLDQVASGWVVP
ncbi:hypothetical protein JQN72_17155 [Phycicoccus sp. CSK15P-2]|uniref:hypothetical protein n=1 Tax=Phycicoccus sp. CSK15P-2 TaxID=2807627 RepID=UPI00194FF812|nr:hypothetical protein [Phycicoccus sp. CSK15P-2]MBM6405973.1 hypothetical protein [Phycicoccus sp. CSK15P-2]